jgi:streptogramin lyase
MRRTSSILLVALALALVAGAPAALAGEPVGVAERFPTKCGADQVSAAPGGGAWFTCTELLPPHHGIRAPSIRAAAGLIDASGQVREFSGAEPLGSRPGVVATAADGSFWFAVESELNDLLRDPPAAALAHVTADGQTAIVPLGLPAAFSVTELVASPNGYLWFVTAEGYEHKNPALWQISPTGAVAKTTAALPNGTPGIAVGSDGNLWFGAGGAGIAAPLTRFTPAGELSASVDPTPGFAARLPLKPAGLATGTVLGAEGSLWYGVQSGRRSAIGRLTPAGAQTEFRNCLSYGQPYFGPEQLIRGGEGNIWFTSLAERSLPNISDPPSIGMVTPAGRITQIFAGVEGRPTSVTAAREGAWFAADGAVERIKPPSGPVNTFHVGRVYRVRSNGTGLLRVKVPGPGTLRVKPVGVLAGAKQELEKLHGPTRSASTKVCGTPQVRVKLTGDARLALQVEGVARVYAEVTFTPVGGTPYSEETLLIFRHPRGR